MNNSENKNVTSFNALVDCINRPGIDKLIAWLRSTDFFTAPASTSFHEAYHGGLLEHSLNVYRILYQLNARLSLRIEINSVLITALFHDLCKVNFYEQTTRNVKVNGQWTTAPYYTVNEREQYGGHGSKSVFLIQQFMPLSLEEAAAINCHMGVINNDYSVFECYRKNPLAFALHTADMMSTCDWNNF